MMETELQVENTDKVLLTTDKVRKKMVQAISEYSMLGEGDRLMVCVSGGKDSSVMLVQLKEIQRRAPYKFEIEAIMLDQKQPGFDASEFSRWVESVGVRLTILQQDTYSIVKEKITTGTFCSLCSRLRRGILYNHAFENKFTKIALGHHMGDLNETLFLNLLYSGKISSMPPKLKSDDGRNILIRPMCLVDEADLTFLAESWSVPIIPCNLCGSQDGLKRKKIKAMIAKLKEEIPDVDQSLLTAQSNVRLSQLSDVDNWNFKF